MKSTNSIVIIIIVVLFAIVIVGITNIVIHMKPSVTEDNIIPDLITKDAAVPIRESESVRSETIYEKVALPVAEKMPAEKRYTEEVSLTAADDESNFSEVPTTYSSPSANKELIYPDPGFLKQSPSVPLPAFTPIFKAPPSNIDSSDKRLVTSPNAPPISTEDQKLIGREETIIFSPPGTMTAPPSHQATPPALRFPPDRRSKGPTKD